MAIAASDVQQLRDAYLRARAAFKDSFEADESLRHECRVAKAALRAAVAEAGPDVLSQPSPSQIEEDCVGYHGASLVFDLNYNDQMTNAEASSLCRQLTWSYAANRRALRPFNLIMGGVGLDSTVSVGTPALYRVLQRSNWDKWTGVRRISSQTPWSFCHVSRAIYLTADSQNELETMEDDCAYVIGGLVDHTDKPGVSYERAEATGLPTARLPLERYLKLHSRTHQPDQRGADITTLAVVQILLLYRETGDWGLALSRCPALRSAPLRKYVRWLHPYEALNDTERPPDLLVRGDSQGYESQALVAAQGRSLHWT